MRWICRRFRECLVPEPSEGRWAGARTPGARALATRNQVAPGFDRGAGRTVPDFPCCPAPAGAFVFAPFPFGPDACAAEAGSAGAATGAEEATGPGFEAAEATAGDAVSAAGGDAAGIAATAGGAAWCEARTAMSDAAPIPSAATPAMSAWRR
ncbi:MAG TPA: hypothetical protein VK762_26110, partial [Polyangiaceae bacterium]|nr:hypothetical protein [Polyangiaceae bacterium]